MQNLSGTDFFVKTTYNNETLTQLWMSQLADSHDSICKCDCPFAHMLATIFPPGHQDRNLTIEQILQRDYKQKCHFGGQEEEKTGGEGGTGRGFKGGRDLENPEDIPEDGLDAMLAAAAAAEDAGEPR